MCTNTHARHKICIILYMCSSLPLSLPPSLSTSLPPSLPPSLNSSYLAISLPPLPFPSLPSVR